jgi:VIT1/CCC1 family predicted Fe2+/Mn2+ transporter
MDPTPEPVTVASMIESYQEEMQSAWLYRVVSAAETDAQRATMFSALGEQAREQAGFWRDKASAAGIVLDGEFVPGWRLKLAAVLVRRFGPRASRDLLAAMKVRGLSIYQAGDGHALPERAGEAESRHRGAGSGNLRAAVFGVNDGLVSNASLIMGMAGAAASNASVLLAGVAGLLAGAFSMAAGEYISVRSQREFFEHQIELERAELETYPEAEARELELIYRAKGLEEHEARRVSQALVRDPAKALDTLAREELGLNPDELGSPIGAAVFSFLSFAAGATLPLLPLLFARGESAVLASATVAGVALFAVGAALSLFTGRSALRSGLRMLAVGAAAGAATYGIGAMIGVGLA